MLLFLYIICLYIIVYEDVAEEVEAQSCSVKTPNIVYLPHQASV